MPVEGSPRPAGGRERGWRPWREAEELWWLLEKAGRQGYDDMFAAAVNRGFCRVLVRLAMYYIGLLGLANSSSAVARNYFHVQGVWSL